MRVFSLRWSLPPTLGCSFKQPDSTDRSAGNTSRPLTGYSTIRAYHPPWVLAAFKRDLGVDWHARLSDSIRNATALWGITYQRLCAGLFPVQSPLLRESLLVSVPPLIDMLKFGGYYSTDTRSSPLLYYTFKPLFMEGINIIVILSMTNWDQSNCVTQGKGHSHNTLVPLS